MSCRRIVCTISLVNFYKLGISTKTEQYHKHLFSILFEKMWGSLKVLNDEKISKRWSNVHVRDIENSATKNNENSENCLNEDPKVYTVTSKKLSKEMK